MCLPFTPPVAGALAKPNNIGFSSQIETEQAWFI